MSYQSGSVTMEDWLKAWRSWAGTRKRGKMAQFIVHKLEEQKQAMWLDITKGKFQLTEWHAIADEWFRQKPRSSDQVDAPCMLRKGLPRAFPGLEEVKSESVKEGTQYRSRVFQATPQLLQEVVLYINKPMYSGSFANGTAASSNAFGVFQPGHPVTSMHNGTSYLQSPPIKIEEQIDVINSPGSSDTHSPAAFINNGPYPPSSSGYLDGNAAILPDGANSSPYNGSPYNDSPLNGVPFTTSPMLNIPASEGDNWGTPGNYSPGHSEQASYYSTTTGSPESYPPQQPVSPGSYALASPGPNLLQVQPFPNQSPLEGGGQLALLFSGELPAGSKWLSFNSQSRPEYMVQVEALQGHDSMALTAIIPKHEFPETVLLTVMAQGQLIAQTEFTYYASAQYNSDMLFHYLTQSLPHYFTDVSLGGHMDLGGDSGGASGYGNYGYGPNIPATSYSLLLGSCRLGIEQLVYATLELKSMSTINTLQLMKAQELAEEHNHANIAKTLKLLAEIQEINSKGEGEAVPAVQTEGGRKAMARLERADNHKECAHGILSRLKSIAMMEEKTQSEGSEAETPTPEQSDKRPDFRRSSSNKLTRQQKKEDEDLLELPSTDKHSRGSIAELKDTVPPLPSAPRTSSSVRGPGRRMLIATHSDAADSAVSMSFDGDPNEYSAEVVRRNSARDASLGLFQFNRDSAECISVKINAESAYTLANSLQYECSYQVTDDYPPNSNPSNVLFKAGDKIVQIGDTPVKDKGPDDFAFLLQQESCHGDGISIRIIPRLSPPPVGGTTSLSLGYGSLDLSEKAVLSRRQSEQQLMSSITMKVSNLLSMKGPGPKRTVTIPRSAGGQGFKLVGGSAVGLFISEVAAGRDEIKIGDQVLEIAGQSTLGMTHYDASQQLQEHKDKVQLKIMENTAKYNALYLQFEHDSFYIRTLIDHTPTEGKDMVLQDGGLARVVNCSLDPNYWFAWAVDSSTGADTVLRRIPNPLKAYGQFNKHVYEKLPSHNIQELLSS